jgi:hypothetical protein
MDVEAATPTETDIFVSAGAEEASTTTTAPAIVELPSGLDQHTAPSTNIDLNDHHKLSHDETDSSKYAKAVTPVDGVGCVEGCARDRHTVLTILTAGLILIPILTLAGAIPFWPFLVIELIMGVIYFINVFCSHTYQYLRNISSTESVLDYIDRMYRTKPTIHWFIQCYHMEMRTRVVSSPGPNGTRTYRVEHYQVPVNTHSARGQLHITRWTDISVPIDRPTIKTYAMTKVSVQKSWIGDAGVEQQKNEFIQMNHRDVLYNLTETMELPGFQEKMLGFVDLDNVPVLAHWKWYLASHLTVVFGLPYRMWFSSKSHKVETIIKKQIWTS